MTNRQSLFDMLETYTFDEFVELLAVKLAEKSSASPRRGKNRKVLVHQPKNYYTTKEVAEMFGCDTRRVTEACRYGRFPPYVKFTPKGLGRLGGYQFEKDGIDRLYRECPKHFVPVVCWKNTPSNLEAKA